MIATRLKCKAHYAAHVKHILPLKWDSGGQNHPKWFIMELAIPAVLVPIRPGPGGFDAHADYLRRQVRQLAPARHPEPSSRTGQGYLVSDPSIFRPRGILARSNTRCCAGCWWMGSR